MARTDVIQGFFPHGFSHAQARVASPGRSAQPVQRLTARGGAVQLPQHLPPFPARGGQPLPPNVRQKMEALFGTSFHDVQVHVGPQAAMIGALACTRGTDIHFAPGQYNPATPQGERILAHELMHVVQQRAGRVGNPFGSGIAVVRDASMDGEAGRMGVRAAAFRGPVQRKVIQRATATEYKKGQERIAVDALNKAHFGIKAELFDDLDGDDQAGYQRQFGIGTKTPDMVCKVPGSEAKVPGDVFTINPSEGYLPPEERKADRARPVKDLTTATEREIEVFQVSVRNAVHLKRSKYAGGQTVVLMDLSRYRNWLGYLPTEANGVYVYDGTRVTVLSIH